MGRAKKVVDANADLPENFRYDGKYSPTILPWIVKYYIEYQCNLANVSRKMGIPRATLKGWYQTMADFRSAIDEAQNAKKDEILAVAINSLQSAEKTPSKQLMEFISEGMKDQFAVEEEKPMENDAENSDADSIVFAILGKEYESRAKDDNAAVSRGIGVAEEVRKN